ncbi:DUF4145 domain-containing protein [Paenibacillus sp. ATY16]|uniref:DUF4145 domain-containing protein n=1 Tax=Paenibacillus sp. ATY16 TaxID=1759312 RepID=UPI00200E99EF|nr:DUF4145 domain-containing protein [Paenibacillus sp. ATY16]MCK9858314.1 hypothetical protein [Paenibacillus sp. ATY16]
MSSFEFLKLVNKNLAQLAEQAEGAIWSSPRTTLIQARLFGEQLAALISQTEKVEPVYAIKQIERLHLLARKDIISDEVRGSFEWLRMNGNAAAHDAKEVPTDLALSAHRHLYAISAWYVEAYGPLDFVVPDYQLPMPLTSGSVEENNELSQEDLSERLEQLLKNQLEDKLLPSIDERFREMNELLVKFAGQMDEWSKKGSEPSDPSISRSNSEIINIKTEVLSQSGDVIENQSEIEIADYMIKKSLDIIDKRENGGALWVIGGWELKDILFALKNQGFYFRFARNGSQSTKRKPAWFLTGKDTTEKRYLTFDSDVVNAEVEITVGSSEYQHEEKTKTQSQSDTESTITDSKTNREDTSVNDLDLEALVKIPSYLQWRKVASYKPCNMSNIAESLGIVYFNDWSEDRLRELYRHQPKLLHNVLVQLWFYGFDFQGELSRFIKLERPELWTSIPSLTPELMLENILTIDIVRQLERFGIRTTDQLVGLPEYSLQWLLRNRYEVVQTALQPHILRDNNETITPITQNEVSSHVIRSEEFEIVIPPQLLMFPIRDLPIYGCSSLLSGIISKCGFTVLGELPTDLISILPKIKGAGPGSLEKMMKQLQTFISKHGDIEQEVALSTTRIKITDQVANESRKLIWEDKIIELSENDLEMPITAAEYPSVKRITRYLDEQSITKVGLLPTMLDQLTKGESVGKTSIAKFVSLLFERLEEYQAEAKMREQLEVMSMPERIDYSLSKTVEKLSIKLTEDEINSNRNLQMLYSRWLEKKEGRKATLEWLGQKFELTRERVRQIINKMLRSFHPDILDLERLLKEACLSCNSFFYFPININDDFIHGLIEQVVEEFEGLIYLERYGWWTTLSQEAVEMIEESLHQHLNIQLRGRVWDEGEIREFLRVKLADSGMPLDLSWSMIFSDLSTTSEGNYYLKNSKKWEVVEMVLRQFPEGVEIYKREEELMSLANIIKPGEYVKERDFASVFVRDDFLEIAYLWGRGTFIHHEFVHVDEQLVIEVANKALELLEKRSPISVNRLFPLYEKQLKESGIPTEYALYTMLRKLSSSKLSLNKFPHIWHSEDAFYLSNAEQIKVYIREHYEPLTVEHLRDEFVGKRGWKRFTLEFSIQTDSDFVSTDLGVVGLREFYPYTSNDLVPLIEKLQDLLTETGVIHVNRLFDVMIDACKSLGIASSYLLYDLLKGLEESKFRLVRYPLILSASHPAGELTLQTLVEQYLEEQDCEVAREVVYHWVTEEVGARAETLDSVLSASNVIYYYQDGQFGEYIHRNCFGWNEEKERYLVDAVLSELNQLDSVGIPYTTITQLMNRLELPVLNNHLTWTEDLLTDCLRKSGSFLLLGSYNYIVVKRSNHEISSETDWLACILRLEFNGRVSRIQWQQRLAELKYSKDGRFLNETVLKLDNKSAPFLIKEDDVVLR